MGARLGRGLRSVLAGPLLFGALTTVSLAEASALTAGTAEASTTSLFGSTGTGYISNATTVPANAMGPTYQIIGASRADSLVAGGLSQTVANYYFNQPKAFMTNGANGHSPHFTVAHIAEAHARYPLASQTWLFNSYGSNYLTKQPGILGVFGHGGIYGPGRANPRGLSMVQYDPEGQASNGTPRAECGALEKGNLSYVKAAIALVHAKGLRLLLTPSIDVGMVGNEGGFPNKYATWLKQHRGLWSAAGEDYYSIQSQQAEGTPYFRSFVQQAIAQSRAAAPLVPVGIGIGINPHSPPTVITTSILVGAYHTGIVNNAAGFWHNVEIGVNANVPVSVYVNFLNHEYAIR